MKSLEFEINGHASIVDSFLEGLFKILSLSTVREVINVRVSIIRNMFFLDQSINAPKVRALTFG